jgi:arylsulfatase A-like enzyme
VTIDTFRADRLGAGIAPALDRLAASSVRFTAAFVGAFVLDRRFGLAQGFDTYDDQIARDPNATERLEAERPASDVVDRALTWLDQPHPAPSTRHPAPFFVWIHLYDPHAPYNPPARFRQRVKTAYDGEIAFADEQIARVFDWLRGAIRTASRTRTVRSGPSVSRCRTSRARTRSRRAASRSSASGWTRGCRCRIRCRPTPAGRTS